jgi:hypothetical protein
MMDREIPRTTSDEINLYIRTYYSLLRSSGEVPVRAFEEAHAFSESSLHPGARDGRPDVAAFAYAAGRLPTHMGAIQRVFIGQSHEQFENAGLEVRTWQRVRTRGRRRPIRWDGAETLAVFVTSTSDIDDLVPIVTAFQIEWNKMHTRLAGTALGQRLASGRGDAADAMELAALFELDAAGAELLRQALADEWDVTVRALAARPADLRLRLLAGSFAEYQRAAQRWWGGIEPVYLREARPRRRPVYFVSSNTHALVNLLGGYARAHADVLRQFARERNPEGLAAMFDDAGAEREAAGIKSGAERDNLLYYLLSAYVRAGGEAKKREVQRFDGESGIRTVDGPGGVDVTAQVIELGRLQPERLDPRVCVAGAERLAQSDAVILNIDYPLGMAAYHHLSRVAQGIGELRGVYVMGKAATLNGKVGDVMISGVAQDEHSANTYLFKNCLSTAHVEPWLRHGTVLDNQKALTVRSAFLQNRDYMGVFYREGYTVLEMEAGPFLSAIYELVSPDRHPQNEIVHLSNRVAFDLGLLHYASDTPYSRRQSLLSKSLSYFGVDATYGCAVAIVRRILARELELLSGAVTPPSSARPA